MLKTFTITITGSRKYQKMEQVDQLINSIHNHIKRHNLDINCIKFITGFADGPDKRACEKIIEYGWPEPKKYLPNYALNGRKLAPILRNDDIARDCDLNISFYDRASSGTKDVMLKCLKYGKPQFIIDSMHPYTKIYIDQLVELIFVSFIIPYYGYENINNVR